jgi:hypothetical protein
MKEPAKLVTDASVQILSVFVLLPPEFVSMEVTAPPSAKSDEELDNFLSRFRIHFSNRTRYMYCMQQSCMRGVEMHLDRLEA